MSGELGEIVDFVLYSTGDGQSLTVGNIGAVLLLLAGGYLASRFIGHLFGQRLAKTRIGPDVAYTIQRIIFLSLLVLVVLTALNLLGVPLTAFAFATGAIAIGVGFGAQNIINNFKRKNQRRPLYLTTSATMR